MKTTFKRFSKKALAMVLSICLILSAMTATFAVFAETAPYQVDFTSPAIPMVKGTQISLADIEVQLEEGGEYVAGSALAVSNVDAGLRYDKASGTLAVYAKGVYPLTVSNGAVTKKIYVVAADTADGPFNIFEYDFANLTEDVASGESEWKLTGFKSNGLYDYTENISNVVAWNATVNALRFGTMDRALWITNDVLKDFADYTIKTTAGSTRGDYGTWRNYGVLARITPSADPDALLNADSKLIMAGMGPGAAQGEVRKVYIARPVYNGNGLANWVDATTPVYWTVNTAYDYAYKFEGKTVTVSVAPEGQELVEVYNFTDNNNILTTTGGGVGVYVDDTNGYFKDLSVELNVTDIPAATAADSLFTVDAANPVIAMSELTKVNLNNMLIGVGDAYVIASADAVQWNIANAGAAVKVEDGYLYAYARGTYKATVTYGDESTTVYIIVNSEDDTDYVIYEEEFGDWSEGGKVPENWSAQYQAGRANTSAWMESEYVSAYTLADTKTLLGDGVSIWQGSRYTGTTGIVPFINYGNAYYNGGAFFVLDNDLVSSFADYTVTAEIVGYSHYKSGSGFGIFGRANTTDGKLTSGSSWIQMYENPFVNTTDKLTPTVHGYNFTNAAASSLSLLNAENVNTGFNTTYVNSVSGNVSTTLVADFKGNTVKFWAKGEESNVYSATVSNTQAGTVGIAMVNGGDNAQSNWVALKNIKVALNNVQKAPAETIDIYKVDTDTEPAIPMNAFTYVSTDSLMIKVNGVYALGSALDLEFAAGVSGAEISGNTIRAYEKGTYKLIATDANGNEEAVYVVVKDEADTEFAIYSEIFGDYTDVTTFPNNWKSQWRQDGNSGAYTRYTWGDFESPRVYTAVSGLHQATSAPGIVPFSNTRSWNSAGYFTLNDEAVSAFSNYTVIAAMAAYSHHNDGTCGIGIFGRANATADGKLDNLSTFTGIYSATHNSKMLARKIESAPGADAASATISRATIGENWDYTNRNSKTENVTMVVKFDGENLSTYMKGDDQSFATTTTNVQKGAVGIYAGMIGDGNVSSFVNLREIKVVLNTELTDIPEAKEIEIYAVTDAAPAIPMNAMTQVKASDLLVNVDGTSYLGRELVFEEIGDSRGISIEDGIFTAFEKGVYPVKVTHTASGATDTVYVVVKNRTDKQWTLFEQSFGSEYKDFTNIPENWKSQYYTNRYAQYYDFSSGSKGAALGIDESEKFTFHDYSLTASYTYPTIGTKYITLTEGIVPFTNFFGVDPIDNKKLSLYDSPGFFTLDNEIIRDFADYTVATTATVFSNYTGLSGTGLYGRAPITEEGRLDSTSTGFTMFVANSKNQTAYSRVFSYGVDNSGASSTGSGTWSINNYETYTFTARYAGTNATFSDGISSMTETAAVKKGGVGVVTYDVGDQGVNTSWCCIKNFAVYLNDTDETAPTSNDLAYDINNIKVAVNTVFDLANVGLKFSGKTVLGYSANIDNVRDVNGEVSNGKFVGFSAGEVTVTANYQGKTTSFTINVVDDGTDNVYADEIADNTVVIEPIISDETDSAYYVTVTPEQGKELAALGLSIYENGKKLSSYQCVDDTGNKFRFETLGIETVKIETEYIEEGVASVAPIGATVRVADANNTAGIKFGNRVNIVTTDGNKITLDGTTNIKLGNTIIENVTVKEIGTLIIPSALIDGELLYTTKNVKRGKATTVSASTAQHSDITAVLVNIPETWYNLPISARAYIAYTVEGDSTVYYYYGDVIERTYNDVYTAAQPARHYYNESTGTYGNLVVDDGTIQDNSSTTIQVETVLEGGTDHYLDNIAQTDDISYISNETITYAFRIKGGYKLRYTVYKDNAELNLYGNETVAVDTATFPHTNKYVKKGVYEGDVFKFSTQMNQPGAVYVFLEVLDESNKLVAKFNHTVIVDFDKVEAAAAAPTSYVDEQGVTVNATPAEFYASCRSDWSAILEKIEEEVESEAFQNYWTAKEADAVYDGTYIYATRKADVSGYYLYDIQLATEEPSAVLEGATKVSELFADTTNNKFLYNDYTVRPSSFNLTLKNDAAAGSLIVRGNYQGYGDASSAGKQTISNALFINMNSHGILNNQASSYYTAIHKVSSKSGGTKGFFTEYNPNAGVGTEKSPTELYAYGIVKRDYIASQFAKMLPEYNVNAKNYASGGSMGGWRSVMAAALDPSIKTVDASYTWMASLGGLENGKIAGHFMPALTNGILYFSTVNAAAVLDKDVTLNFKACGMGDYTSPPVGLVAAYNAATCKKSIELRQYREHGTTRTATHFDMRRVAEP